MTRDELQKQYWNYYLNLEKSFLEARKYVELDETNFSTFSDHFALLMQAIGAELDCVFKEFCELSTSSSNANIKQYAAYVQENYQDIGDRTVKVCETNIELKPFEEWNKDNPGQHLSWWQAFTSIKHNRYGNRQKANLKNVLNILGALFLLENLLLLKIVNSDKDIDSFDWPSKIFSDDLPHKNLNIRAGAFYSVTENLL